MSQSDDVFDFGERTIFQLRSQPFTVEEEFGTMALTPGLVPQVVEEVPVVSADPIVELQQKLDAALRQIAALQQRVDSMDATLARALSR